MRRAAPERRRRRARSRRPRASLPEDGAWPQRRERFLAVLVVGAVDDQHAVEVVELVLRDARAVALELVADVGAVLVLAFEHQLRRALDRHANALQREAAFVVRLGVAPLLDD